MTILEQQQRDATWAELHDHNQAHCLCCDEKLDDGNDGLCGECYEMFMYEPHEEGEYIT